MGEGLWFHDWGQFGSGLAMFFIAVLGERPRVKPKDDGTAAQAQQDLPRNFSPDEFAADTQEDRSLAVLADKRREFLARLQAQEKDTSSREH